MWALLIGISLIAAIARNVSCTLLSAEEFNRLNEEDKQLERQLMQAKTLKRVLEKDQFYVQCCNEIARLETEFQSIAARLIATEELLKREMELENEHARSQVGNEVKLSRRVSSYQTELNSIDDLNIRKLDFCNHIKEIQRSLELAKNLTKPHTECIERNKTVMAMIITEKVRIARLLQEHKRNLEQAEKEEQVDEENPDQTEIKRGCTEGEKSTGQWEANETEKTIAEIIAPLNVANPEGQVGNLSEIPTSKNPIINYEGGETSKGYRKSFDSSVSQDDFEVEKQGDDILSLDFDFTNSIRFKNSINEREQNEISDEDSINDWERSFTFDIQKWEHVKRIDENSNTFCAKAAISSAKKDAELGCNQDTTEESFEVARNETFESCLHDYNGSYDWDKSIDETTSLLALESIPNIDDDACASTTGRFSNETNFSDSETSVDNSVIIHDLKSITKSQDKNQNAQNSNDDSEILVRPSEESFSRYYIEAIIIICFVLLLFFGFLYATRYFSKQKSYF